jgi:hypothetical protein
MLQAAEQGLQEARRQLAREQSGLVALYRALGGLEANATNAEMLGAAAQKHEQHLEQRLRAVVLAEVSRTHWPAGGGLQCAASRSVLRHELSGWLAGWLAG